MVTLHEVITFLVSMQISISSLQTHNVNRCGRSRHLARKLSLRRKRSSPNVFEMAATETITSIILIKLIRVSLGTVRHPRRFKIVVIDIQITLKQMLRDFIGIRVNRAKKSGMVNITSSVNSRERSGINTILHELNPLFTINVTMRDIKSKNVYSRVNSKATTQWRKTESRSEERRVGKECRERMRQYREEKEEDGIEMTRQGANVTQRVDEPASPVRPSCLSRSSTFFFKQKTAYEIGLGIPAEPLFRSNTILHELNPLFTINVTMRDIKSKNVYSRVNSKATTQWRKTES